MKNIHILPTDKRSRLTIRLKTNELMYSYKESVNQKYNKDISLNQNQHIYITSDEEIKEGDWIIWNKKIVKAINTAYYSAKKIILTTDQDLIKDGVQAIGDEFIELFVKNLNCESIEVCKNPFYEESNYEHYKIIIPQEEPKQETLEEALNSEIKLVHDVVRNKDFDLGFQTGGIFGAKWQADRMYSEEEVDTLLEMLKRSIAEINHIKHTYKDRGHCVKYLSDCESAIEQFKKK
jgi:hypothetical protein